MMPQGQAGINLKSFAKINLSLKVSGLRSDGFHEIDSTMQSISLYDLIFIEKIPTSFEIICDHPQVPKNEHNLIFKAAKILGLDKQGLRFTIEKNIPIAAGLAGGSGNAAAALIGLNQLFDLRLSPEEIATIGLSIGSDVPFCLKGGRARCCGQGEKMTPLPIAFTEAYILINPGFEVSTKEIYAAFDNFLHKIDLDNDLEKVARQKHPEIEAIEADLIQHKAKKAQMSGSGPTVFGIFSSLKEAQAAFLKLQKKYPRAYLTSPSVCGVEVL